MGLILDTSVAVDGERTGLPVPEWLDHVRTLLGPEEIALSVITAVELEHGIWRAQQEAQMHQRRLFVEDLLAAVPVYPLTTEIARRAGKIDAQSKQQGVVVPFQDLLIGATALQFGYAVGTSNVRHFQMIPGLEVKQL